MVFSTGHSASPEELLKNGQHPVPPPGPSVLGLGEGQLPSCLKLPGDTNVLPGP
jgi:hypothetical protein